MTPLRQALCGALLIGVLALLFWGQQQRVNAANSKSNQAQEAAATARQDAARNLANVNALTRTLQQERDAQRDLRVQQDQLRQGLAKRERTIEDLKRENEELRQWADQPLPDAARRLRDRPAFTGAAAYRQWLSGRSAVPPVSNTPAE